MLWGLFEMKVKDLKEMLEKIPDESEVLVSEYIDTCGNISICSYDEPCINTFSLYDGKLLIKGYDDKTCFEYKRRVINSEDIEKNSKKIDWIKL